MADNAISSRKSERKTVSRGSERNEPGRFVGSDFFFSCLYYRAWRCLCVCSKKLACANGLVSISSALSHPLPQFVRKERMCGEVRAVRCPIFLASLSLVRKLFRNKWVTGLSFIARIKRPPLHLIVYIPPPSRAESIPTRGQPGGSSTARVEWGLTEMDGTVRFAPAIGCPIFFASLPLVRKWFRTKRVTGLSFTARIERPQLYRGGSARKKGGPVNRCIFLCTSFHSFATFALRGALPLAGSGTITASRRRCRNASAKAF